MLKNPFRSRWARLGDQRIYLLGRMPKPGDRLRGRFSIPAARHARMPLTDEALATGLVIVSTLPNIEKHACMAQIVELEERGREVFPGGRLVHVSADQADHWREVDQFHPDMRAEGYSLCCADPASRAAFVESFGVGVEGHHRIAHGLFALRHGVFLAAEIPGDQMRTPEVREFIERLMGCFQIDFPAELW
jgi:hypothetical protein